MKVIKKGRPQKGWSNEFKCTGTGNGNGGCNATLLIEKIDLFTTYSSSYDGSNETYVTFECCECGVKTDIKNYPLCERDLPTHSKWKDMKKKAKEPLRIELSNEDISKIVGGGRVNRQVVSGLFNNAPLLDLEIVAEGHPSREDFSELVDEAIEEAETNKDPHNQAWLADAECSKCGRVYCDCETKY